MVPFKALFPGLLLSFPGQEVGEDRGNGSFPDFGKAFPAGGEPFPFGNG